MARKVKGYTVAQAEKLAEKDLRRLYSKYASEARKRAKVLKDEFGVNIGEQFKPVSAIKDAKDVAKALSQVSKFLRSPSTKKQYGEYRAKSIATLRSTETAEGWTKPSYDFVNEKNFEKFGQFMGEMRNAGVLDEYDSAEVAEAFGTRKRWTKKQIENIANAYKENESRYENFTDIVEGFIRIE